MSDSSNGLFTLPPEQQAIRDNCFHPSRSFVEFPNEDVETSIPARFEKIVELYSDRLAVKDGDRSLTYRELNTAANRIAHAILQTRGPKSEPIALLFEHGIDIVAAILGVLKAGKFYVVLDSSFPQERMAYIAEDSGSPLIVTNNRNIESARRLAEAQRCTLNIDEIANARFFDNTHVPVSPSDLVSIRYTSGSTGEPKGVMEQHRNALNSAQAMTKTVNLAIHDRLTLLQSLAFAAGHNQLRLSLLNGASLYPFDVKSKGLPNLIRYLTEEQITICRLPTSLFRQFGESLSDAHQFEHLRLICLSGAPITRVDFRLYQERFGSGTKLRIAMGSSETRGICSAILDRSFSFPAEGTPLGYPKPGKQISLVDDNNVASATGQVGEIVVKGRSLNLGYWNRPELTKTKFRPDPCGGDEVIYHTGDLGKMLPDGFLIHLGRKDNQLKIRGYRVELGEIENALRSHLLVKEAAVAAWDLQPGEKYLAAYVVPRTNATVTILELRDFVKSKLPDYMLPSVFIVLDSLPLTNGKLDRKALPPPDHKRPHVEYSYTAPRSDAETSLVQIWEEILQIHPIGIHDNFFDLGGHSLAASRIITRVIQSCQLELPLKALFDAPTVAKMAAIIDQHRQMQATDTEIEQLLSEVESMTEAQAQNQLAPSEPK
jgi:amino acid adenylation domain-containing protein